MATDMARNFIPKTILVPIFICICTYAVFEAVVTVLYLKDVVEPPATTWYFEDTGRTVHFDPVRGYRLTTVPSRITRITMGYVEYVGEFRGNNQGFPDRDDFLPQRGNEKGKRFAVFGDSYTAAQFLNKNWPDHVEDLSRDAPEPLHLLNFSVDGGGLANWWSVLTRLVEHDDYEIDGVIFAVIPGDLWRRFSIGDHQDRDRPMFGRIPTWDPKALPTTLEEARKYLRPQSMNGHIVSTDEFDRALNLTWRPPSDKPVRPYFARKLWHALKGRLPQGSRVVASPKAFDSFDPGQEWMIEDIARAIKTMNVPAMVIHIPSRENLLEGSRDASPPLDTRLFAALLDARLVDGKQAFAESNDEEIRAMWLRYDAHWGQPGSDAFGQYMTGVLSDWP